MDIQIYDVIDGVTAATVKRLLASGSNEPITLHINSPGGNVTDALAIFNNLHAYAGNVTAFVDGLAASSATLVMLAADEVVMAAHSRASKHLTVHLDEHTVSMLAQLKRQIDAERHPSAPPYSMAELARLSIRKWCDHQAAPVQHPWLGKEGGEG